MASVRTGTIVDWNDARGFGFISDPGVQGRVFVHVKDFAEPRRPSAGDEVAYELIEGRDGRPAARLARITSARHQGADNGADRVDAPMRVTVRIVGALALATAVLCCVIFGRAPAWLALCYVAGSCVSFAAYWLDKRAAMRGTWRTMEETLHFFDLAFGIAGGLMAQGLLRHKSSKLRFGIVSAGILVVHLTILALLLMGYGPADWLAWITS